ncbi:ankyrin repeat domain-containing protein [Sulfuricurvum sp.]|uniref:ankyrin repeat domain-containing protein n=1 Tax=Sulfuricurvum sp. TaxID=2025608 RepID=UPI002E35D8BC|nr:ankyrin repeat domain-containing protein [Sulfuricurvum sp.]HEX5330929.1 ankyrin repeat domain-containing protein [Sulfuricurvum sp.]
MRLKYPFLIAVLVSTFSLHAADILDLVGLLDRNDTKTFQTRVQTLSDANAAREDNNKTILMYACWVGNTQAVNYLIDKGADVNAQDVSGATALHLAAWKGFTPIALHLIDRGASGSIMSKDGMTPLDIAIMQGNQEIASAIEKATPKRKKLL